MKYLKLEMRRMLKSKGLKIALLIGVAFVVSHAKIVMKYAAMNGNEEDLLDIPFSAFMFFMGYDMYGWQGSFFFQMAPLLAAIPFANSYFVDISEGYVKNLVSRGDKRQYLVAKYVAIFASGGMAVALPLVLDILMCTALLPSYLPNISTGLFSITYCEFYYTHPWIFIMLFLLVDFLFGGIYAVSALLVTELIENKYLLSIFPYVFMILWSFISTLCEWLRWPVHLSIPEGYHDQTGAGVYVCVIGIMIVLTFVVHYVRGMKKDVL